MRTTRSLISLLLVLVMLPWGAYAGSHSASARVTHIVAITAAQAACTDDSAAIATTSPHQEASVKRKCRITTLPGSPCGPDRVILAAALPFGAGPTGMPRLSFVDWIAPGPLLTPPRAPPRSI